MPLRSCFSFLALLPAAFLPIKGCTNLFFLLSTPLFPPFVSFASQTNARASAQTLCILRSSSKTPASSRSSFISHRNSNELLACASQIQARDHTTLTHTHMHIHRHIILRSLCCLLPSYTSFPVCLWRQPASRIAVAAELNFRLYASSPPLAPCHTHTRQEPTPAAAAAAAWKWAPRCGWRMPGLRPGWKAGWWPR